LDSENINDETLEIIAKTMKLSKAMRRLKIDCQKKKLITDAGLRFIGGNIHQMTSLRSISINFMGRNL